MWTCFKIRRAFQLGSAHREEGLPSLLPALAMISLSDLPGMDAAASAGRLGQSGEQPMHKGREARAEARPEARAEARA